ncbi:MAG: RNA polymerase factor sigma-54 [Sulfurimonas sp. RIFOXYD12_FULL_33_39]|uniref:RNA polymerase factor sigma-54 n=1 Tax=unclassified Sulfurimonas TaxID=2623549 RepID=UPI0008C9734E|nr:MULTISPECIES: RNA polymerase factor sigma-54 [unclassified Sulfurimonas]OHE02545.1 MAG: RNA polymerase factor sigma-54 [Sulfurimonas sp. RIFCSPLOWO2_12_FULL_34_6]OHE09316.1 MAG: RNA polymerase factor sigma-54 [Sulfurimonas sp. RIFOXYD12_FULL_33_39]OHE12901.1 MAG: RNA polymerase factor sigma-54 [Sulfurimonas sp. RIFOXYD2_FULL_34_21]DAB27313.1 MAG TPA: RNA polymerase factor sigma-54 [Sulfurimonas sp. UBA10385]
MAALKQTQSVENKHKLSNTLRNWLPILHSSLSDLGEAMSPFVEANPVIEVVSGYEESFESKIPKKIISSSVSNTRTEQIEALTIANRSLYDVLDEQIEAPLFPTPLSQKIASFVVANLDENGYYEGNSEAFCKDNNINEYEFEKVRKRFAHVEPVGIAAKNLAESFIFQLDYSDISDEAYSLAVKVIEDIENIYAYSNEKNFQEVMRVLGTFKNPPAIEYLEESSQIIPDLMIYFNDDNSIEVKLNDAYYPTINIDMNYGVEHEFVSQKIKEAKSLVDALDMRKATLYKVGLMIVEYQYEFFTGGAIMPLTLKTLADEFGHNPSTISRAIANKYIACNRGIYAMKEFFTTAIDEDVSNAAIKEFLVGVIKQENRKKPLSDMKLLELIQEKFKVQMVRRTIAKYRKQLNIAGSSERKKLYHLH